MSDNGKDINLNEGQKVEDSPKVTPVGEQIDNSVSLIELRIHKTKERIVDGETIPSREHMEIIAQEIMMTDHKDYMIDKLLEAIHIVNHAQKRKPTLIRTTTQNFNRLKSFLLNKKRR